MMRPSRNQDTFALGRAFTLQTISEHLALTKKLGLGKKIGLGKGNFYWKPSATIIWSSYGLISKKLISLDIFNRYFNNDISAVLSKDDHKMGEKNLQQRWKEKPGPECTCGLSASISGRSVRGVVHWSILEKVWILFQPAGPPRYQISPPPSPPPLNYVMCVS